MRIQSTDEIRDVLNDLDFPASKEEIVDRARERTGTRSDTARALAALPPGEYANLREVLRSVPVEPAPGRSDAERVSQHRHHRHTGLAEHERESELPVVEEELRKSPREPGA